MAQKDVKSRIGSVKNIQKITRAMEMVAAARLRRAEQRIEALRPYASAIGRMTRQAAEAAGNVPNLPILDEHASVGTVGLLLVTGDRGLAGAFNSQIVRAGVRVAAEHEGDGRSLVWYASGRRGTSSLQFRGREVAGSYTGFTGRPARARRVRARSRGHPPAPDPRLRRDLDLPRAARVDRVRARRAHDGHAQRVAERRRHHQGPDPADEPRASGGDHAGDSGSRRRGRGPRVRRDMAAPT